MCLCKVGLMWSMRVILTGYLPDVNNNLHGSQQEPNSTTSDSPVTYGSLQMWFDLNRLESRLSE